MKEFKQPKINRKIVAKAAKKIAKDIRIEDTAILTGHLIDAWYATNEHGGFYLAKYIHENMGIDIDVSIVNILDCMKFEVNYILSRKMVKYSDKVNNG